MREEPVYPFEFLLVGVIGIVERLYFSVECILYIWLQAAIDYVELFKVCEDGERRIPVPSVANRLVKEVGVPQLACRLLRFDEEFRIAEVRCEEEGVVGSLLSLTADDFVLDPDFVFMRILLAFVGYVPAERGEEFIYEVLADVRLLVIRRKLIRLMNPEIFCQFLYSFVCLFHYIP